MNEFEQRLRDHLHAVDGARVDDPDTVRTAAGRAARRLDRRRRATVAVGAMSVVAVGALAVWAAAGDDGQRSVTVPSAESTVPAPSSTFAPTTTVASTSVAPTPAPSTVQPAGAWQPIAPDPRGPSFEPSVVWTGTEALVLGGSDASGMPRQGMAAYDPALDSWRDLAAHPGGWQRLDPLVVWTGSQMLVIGGTNADGSVLVSAAEAYDPATDRWSVLPSPPVGFITERSPYVWTGTELLVWPGDGGSTTMPVTPISYWPATGDWFELPAPPIDRRQSAASVWTGSEWIVWGGANGGDELDDGAAFDVRTSTWRALGTSPLSARKVHGVWTGTEMIVSAGSVGGDPDTGTGEFALSDGAAYDPATDSWRPISAGLAHPGFQPVWTGSQLVMIAKGGAVTYDVATDKWVDTCCDGLGAFGRPVWTGSAVLVVGSSSATLGGGLFTPPAGATP